MESAADASTRPSKRARHSLEQDNWPLHASPFALSTSNLERHPEFWFNDGNLVLVVQHMGFRIYRGLLAAQSTIFADMFASSSSSADETLDGCPVVHLTDSHHDVAHLLRVLLPTSPIRYDSTSPECVRSFNEISAVVRLAHKYDIPSVQDQAIHTLQEYHFPNDFTVLSGPSNERISVKRIHCIGVVNLARLTDTPLMLPSALYQCCCLGARLLDGWTREDGTVEHLSTADLKRCFDARATLSYEQSIFLSRLFDPVPLEQCAVRGRCIPYMTNIARCLMTVELMGKKDALGDWANVIRTLRPKGVCESCQEVMLQRNQVERQWIWDSLPRIFGIAVEGWVPVKLDGEGASV